MHQFRNKKEIEKKHKIIRYIIILVVLLVLAYLGAFSFLGKISNYLGWPIWKSEKVISEKIDDNRYLLNSRRYLFSENERLQKENEDIKISMLDYQALEKENEELKRILGRLPENGEFVLANILVKPSHSVYDTIVIDIGKNLGIEIGNKIYANGYIPIGVVSEVYNKTSLITLYSSPGYKIEGTLEEVNANVELTGRGGGNFEMIVSKDLPSTPGMLVLLPGLKVQILAYINAIISTPTDPIKKVLLSSPINVQGLKWVEVKKD